VGAFFACHLGDCETVPITPFLQGQAFQPEVTRAMGIAFDSACRSLRLSATADLATEVVARKIIELAQKGLIDPEQLCRDVLKALNLPHDAA